VTEKTTTSDPLRTAGDAIRHPSLEMRLAALKYIHQQDVQAIALLENQLVEALRDEDDEQSLLACETLSKARLCSEDVLRRAIDMSYVKRESDRAAAVVWQQRAHAAAFVEAIAELLAQSLPDREAIVKLAQTLAFLGESARASLPQLFAAFVQNAHDEPVLAVADAIAVIGFDKAVAVDTFNAFAHEDERAVRKIKGPRWNPTEHCPYGSGGPFCAAQCLLHFGRPELISDTKYADHIFPRNLPEDRFRLRAIEAMLA